MCTVQLPYCAATVQLPCVLQLCAPATVCGACHVHLLLELAFCVHQTVSIEMVLVDALLHAKSNPFPVGRPSMIGQACRLQTCST